MTATPRTLARQRLRVLAPIGAAIAFMMFALGVALPRKAAPPTSGADTLTATTPILPPRVAHAATTSIEGSGATSGGMGSVGPSATAVASATAPVATIAVAPVRHHEPVRPPRPIATIPTAIPTNDLHLEAAWERPATKD